VKKRQLGPFAVSEIGLGCMNLSHAYGVPPQTEVAEGLLEHALECGVTLFDTAALYGYGANEQLVGRVLAPRRRDLVLATKGGMTGVDGPGGKERVIDGRPQAIRRDCEASLRRLGTDVIDLYYLHRVDLANGVPVEESVGEMSRLREEGKVRALGLSEVSSATLRRAHQVHPIAALQSEYSLWTRNPELGALAACREFGVAFVAFSPLGRGFFCGTLSDVRTLVTGDIRRPMPRFSPDNYTRNQRLLEGFLEIAREAGCSQAQLALAWLLHKDESVIPIPGTTNRDHLVENLGAADVTLNGASIARLDALINQHTVAGARYAPATLAEIDTEISPDVLLPPRATSPDTRLPTNRDKL
jgi:aryl-alcohol dehydrogenase-like predicted oxidoreductase